MVVFPEVDAFTGDVVHPLIAMIFGPHFYEVALEILFSGSFLFGVPCLHATFFSRPRIVFQEETQSREYVYNYPVDPSTTVST